MGYNGVPLHSGSGFQDTFTFDSVDISKIVSLIRLICCKRAKSPDSEQVHAI
jgi:hypothetical protein